MATSLRASVNSTREQKLYHEYLTRLRSKDRELLHALDGTVGPLERGFTSATNPDNPKKRIVGFYGEWSDELPNYPSHESEALADAQVALWHGRLRV